MPLDYQGAFRKAFAENRADVRRAAAAGEIDAKIRNFCELHGFTVLDVKRQIQSNDVVAALFTKNPNKQNLFERIAAEFIRHLPGVEEFEQLPNRALHVFSGQILRGDEVRDMQPAGRIPKSIDFRWKYGGVEFYAAHKYTKEAGGAQGNQYHDLQSFITAASLSGHRNRRFIAIADGPFYAGQNGTVGVSRMRRLQQLATTRYVEACAIDELADVMRRMTST